MHRELAMAACTWVCVFVVTLHACGTLAIGNCPMQKVKTSTCPGTYIECNGQLTQIMCTNPNYVNNQHEVLNGDFSCQASSQQEQCVDDTHLINCTKQGSCNWDASRTPSCFLGPNFVNTFHVRKIASPCPPGG